MNLQPISHILIIIMMTMMASLLLLFFVFLGTASLGKTESSPSGRAVILLDHRVLFCQLLGVAKLLRKPWGFWAVCLEEAQLEMSCGCMPPPCSSVPLAPLPTTVRRRKVARPSSFFEFTSTIISKDQIRPRSVHGTVRDKGLQVLGKS